MVTAISENEKLLEKVTTEKLARRNRNRPVTKAQVAIAIRATLAKLEAERQFGTEPFSFAKAVRGLMAMKGNAISSSQTVLEEDIAYAKAMTSGSVPGQYLVPVLQADRVISQLAQYAVARAAGATIWSVVGGLTLNVPIGIVAPTVLWVAQNSRQAPDTATNLGQLSFTVKQQSALLVIPLQLLRTAKPAFDVILSDSFALACAESEDSAMFASVTQAGAPGALLAAAGITTLNAANNSVNGGNLLYGDILACMLKAAQLKLKPPLCWVCSPRTLYTRLLGLSATASRPLLVPDLSDPATSGYSLMGYPLYCTASISETEAVGSGSNQSHLILTTPRSIQIAEDRDVTMEVSLEAYFDSAQAGLRIGHQVDFGVAPAASLIVLAGIN